MKDRIFKVMKWTGLNLSQFADAIQVSPALLSSVKSERTKPTLLLLENIKRVYPEIDVNWLVTGNGEMLVGMPGGLVVATDKETTATMVADVPVADKTTSTDGIKTAINEENNGSATKPIVANDEHDVARPAPAAKKEVVSVAVDNVVANNDSVQAKGNNPVRAVKQVLLMYNDGTYESFEK